MTIRLDHTIVPAEDKVAAAKEDLSLQELTQRAAARTSAAQKG